METTIKQAKCERCNHVWFPRSVNRPGVCPVCKRKDWDKPAESTPQETPNTKGKTL